MIIRAATPEILRSLLECNYNTGVLTWLPRPPTSQGNKMFNTRFSGKEALTCTDSKGYREGRILTEKYRAHRVIFAMYHGYWPEEIDHINRVKGDNSISNLRPVSHQENMRNQPIRSNNISGTVGVSWVKTRNKWRVRSTTGGKTEYLGVFSNKDDAITCRKEADLKYDFHPNHGREL